MSLAALVFALSPWGHTVAPVVQPPNPAPISDEPSTDAPEPETEPDPPVEPEPDTEPAPDPRKEAAQAFAMGVEAYKAGDYEQALGHFERAQAQAEHNDTLYNIGLTQQHLDRHQDAWRSFSILLRDTTDPQERKEIVAARAESQSHIAFVRVWLDAPTTVCLDDAPMKLNDEHRARTLTSPGEHTIRIGDSVRVIELEHGETRTIERRNSGVLAPTTRPARRPLRVLSAFAIGGSAIASGLAVGSAVADDRDIQLGLGVGAAGAGVMALTSTIVALAIHRRARKARPRRDRSPQRPPPPVGPCIPAR